MKKNFTYKLAIKNYDQELIDWCVGIGMDSTYIKNKSNQYLATRGFERLGLISESEVTDYFYRIDYKDNPKLTKALLAAVDGDYRAFPEELLMYTGDNVNGFASPEVYKVSTINCHDFPVIENSKGDCMALIHGEGEKLTFDAMLTLYSCKLSGKEIVGKSHIDRKDVFTDDAIKEMEKLIKLNEKLIEQDKIKLAKAELKKIASYLENINKKLEKNSDPKLFKEAMSLSDRYFDILLRSDMPKDKKHKIKMLKNLTKAVTAFCDSQESEIGQGGVMFEKSDKKESLFDFVFDKKNKRNVGNYGKSPVAEYIKVVNAIQENIDLLIEMQTKRTIERKGSFVKTDFDPNCAGCSKWKLSLSCIVCKDQNLHTDKNKTKRELFAKACENLSKEEIQEAKIEAYPEDFRDIVIRMNAEKMRKRKSYLSRLRTERDKISAKITFMWLNDFNEKRDANWKKKIARLHVNLNNIEKKLNKEKPNLRVDRLLTHLGFDWKLNDVNFEFDYPMTPVEFKPLRTATNITSNMFKKNLNELTETAQRLGKAKKTNLKPIRFKCKNKDCKHYNDEFKSNCRVLKPTILNVSKGAKCRNYEKNNVILTLNRVGYIISGNDVEFKDIKLSFRQVKLILGNTRIYLTDNGSENAFVKDVMIDEKVVHIESLSRVYKEMLKLRK